MAVAYPYFTANDTHAPPRPMAPLLTQDDLKRIAAYKAVEHVKSGMVIGLGTGSTARHAVDRIADLLKQGKLRDVVGVATSTKTRDQAASLGIPLSDLDTHPALDLAIDGADEVDPDLNLVKGRGGSLLREKMIESVSKKFIVIVDESKLVSHIGGSRLGMPVEVIPFCWEHSLRRLVSLFADRGCFGELRRSCGEDGETYREIGDLKEAGDRILRLPGIVEHGMFVGMATSVIVAGVNGVTVKTKAVGGGLEVDCFNYGDLRNGF
ncbi:ribose 5-phosphate isomerase family protein [Striga asiatica]|uniref:ribose-5-phosphate isomerase n=1 Tax=Striga asiatica TaxID=4170 RepID=A0A5A7PIY2_STRAF|nr:ribose 5-phosphate isomerase family protein [Striga asiatica]